MDNLADFVGGKQQKGGKRWRLVFTSGSVLLEAQRRFRIRTLEPLFARWVDTAILLYGAGKGQVSKAMKGEKAGGIYFPITAVQVVPL